MRKLFAVNILGVVLSAVWAGYVWPGGHFPIMAMVAGGLFLIAMVLPFWLQHRALENSFSAITADMQDDRRPRLPGEAEIFTDAPPPTAFRRPPQRHKLVLGITVVAVLLLVGDTTIYLIDKPAAPPDRGLISNF